MKEAENLIKSGSNLDALVALKNLLDLDPSDSAAKAMYERTSNKIKDAGDKNIDSESGNREKIRSHFISGLDYYASGDFNSALREWDMVIEASPLQRQVYELINKTKDRLKKTEDQKKNVELLRQQKISRLYNEAVVSHTKGKFEESIGLWKQILEMDPSNREAKQYLEKVTEEYRKIQRQNLGW